MRRAYRVTSTIGICCLLGCLSSSLHAAETPTAPARDFKTYQPEASVVRIDTASAPRIDGDINDAVWAKATVISEFYQLEPNEGAPASERTEIRILYDEDNIYFAVHAFDREPELIKASVKARDGRLGTDDLIRIYLDPQMSRHLSGPANVATGWLFLRDQPAGRTL